MAGLDCNIVELILSYTDIKELKKKMLVCRQWYITLRPKLFELRKSKNLLKKDGETFCLSKWIDIQHNRQEGRYRKPEIHRVAERDISWMQCVKGNLYASYGNVIQLYTKEQSRIKPKNFTHGKNVTKFVIKDNPARIVSGSLDGHIYILDSEGNNRRKVKVTTGEPYTPYSMDNHIPYSMDYHDRIIVSSSRNKNLKVLKLQLDDCNKVTGRRLESINAGGDVWSLTLSQCGSVFACGLDYNTGDAQLSLIDLNSQQRCDFGVNDDEIGRGTVYDLEFMDKYTLLTCGNVVRLWDIRNNSTECTLKHTLSGSSEQMIYYCVKSDGVRNIYAGCQNGSVYFWDIRYAQRPVQILEVGKNDMERYPVRALDFDSRRLYVALAQNIKILDYSA